MQALIPAADHVAAGVLSGRTGAFLTVSDGAARVDLVLATLPGLLYRVSTPADSGLAPVVRADGSDVVAGFRPTGADGPDTVRIVLNRAVRWAISLPAGAGEQRLDLRGGRLSGVALGACGLAELKLPDPVGTVPVTFTSGVGTVVMTTPSVPARVVLGSGSGRVVTPWAVVPVTGPGTVVGAPGWARARDRYAISAYEEVGELTLDQEIS